MDEKNEPFLCQPFHRRIKERGEERRNMVHRINLQWPLLLRGTI